MAKGLGKGREGGLESGSLAAVLVVLTLIGLGITKIVLGSVYIHDCTLQKMIPIYLIVSGLSPLLFGGFLKKQDEEETSSSTAGKKCGMIGILFNLGWLISGSYWVYPTYTKVHSSKFVPCHDQPVPGCTNDTCKNILVDFAFAMVTLDWIFIGLGCVLIIIARRKV